MAFRSKEEWKNLIDEFESSDLTFSEYCAHKNIPYSTLHKYKSIYLGKDIKRKSSKFKINKNKVKQDSIEAVEIKPNDILQKVNTHPTIKLTSDSGVVLEFYL